MNNRHYNHREATRWAKREKKRVHTDFSAARDMDLFVGDMIKPVSDGPTSSTVSFEHAARAALIAAEAWHRRDEMWFVTDELGAPPAAEPPRPPEPMAATGPDVGDW